jgi:hypothetical protein
VIQRVVDWPNTVLALNGGSPSVLGRQSGLEGFCSGSNPPAASATHRQPKRDIHGFFVSMVGHLPGTMLGQSPGRFFSLYGQLCEEDDLGSIEER